MESCEKHPHEMGVALCGRCGAPWCGTCLVYSFGPKKPPFCMSCAMFAGGVRSTAPRPPMPRKQLKALMRAHKAEVKASAKAPKTESTEAESTERVDTDAALVDTDAALVDTDAALVDTDAALVDTDVSLLDTDWSTPWWEDRQPVAAAD